MPQLPITPLPIEKGHKQNNGQIPTITKIQIVTQHTIHLPAPIYERNYINTKPDLQQPNTQTGFLITLQINHKAHNIYIDENQKFYKVHKLSFILNKAIATHILKEIQKHIAKIT